MSASDNASSKPVHGAGSRAMSASNNASSKPPPQKRGFRYPSQIGYLPPQSPYDLVRTKWLRIVVVASMVPVVIIAKVAWIWSSVGVDDSAGAIRPFSSLGFIDRFRTNLSYSAMKRNNVDRMQVLKFDGRTKISIEITMDELCEKGHTKALEDALNNYHQRMSSNASKD